MDLQALLDLLARIAELTDDELGELETNLVAAGDARAELTDEAAVAELGQIADAVEAVRAEMDTRAEAEATRTAEADAALARIRGQQDGGGEGEGGEGAEGDPAADPAEGDPPAEGEPGAGEGGEGGEGGGAEGGEGDPEALAAGAAPARPRLGRVAARRPAAMRARPARDAAAGQLPDDIADWGLVAAANAPNTPHGQPIRTREDLSRAFVDAINATRGFRGGRTKVNIAHTGNENVVELYGPDRTLDLNVAANIRRIEGAVGHQAIVAAGGFDAITAAGGICAPVPIRYDLPVLGTDERPVRDDALVRFGADRGGVRVIPPPVLEELDGAIGIWTEENDQDPDDPAVKPCLVMTCPDDEEALVDAITRCLQIGNFRSRYFGEQVEAWMRLAAVNHARVAEVKLITAVGADSTQVTTGQGLGAAKDVLTNLDRADAIIRQSNRIGPRFPMRFVFPFWLYNMIRTDIARELPAGSLDERLALAEAQIDRWFTARAITPTPILDGESGQMFGRQGDGPMQGWPSTVVTYLYPDGSHLFLDGGTLDLGIVRDSTLNRTNDAQVFAETFEGHIFHGVESWRITMDLCPDGTTSGTVDFDPCTIGS